jgi:PAS domain S-box-containing protein
MNHPNDRNSADHQWELETALNNGEGRFQKLVEQAPVAMAVVGMTGDIEFINKKAVQVFGFLHEDIPTMDRWWQQAYPDESYRAQVVADWMGRVEKALREGGEIVGNEYRATCKDGTIKTVFINGVPVLDKIFVMFEDITERKLSEQRLRDSEERFSKAFRISPYAFVIANMEDGKIVEVNNAFTTVSGYSREEALMNSTLDLKIWVCEEDRQRMVETLLSGRPVERLETKLRGKNGIIKTVLLFAHAIRLGDKPCIISIVEDITERRQVEEAISRTTKLDSLGVLAGGIAHDFNNLLTGIFGYIDLACTVSKDALVTEYLETTLASMNRARALTLQLLTFAKGGAPVKKVTPLIPFIQEAAQFALSGSNVLCHFSLAETLWQCNIDKNQIAQVIDNIVINAQQAMPNGGAVEITAENISLGENERPPLKEGDYVMISIRDFGIGISKDIIPRIFDPFYTTKTKGHGLGLATCYSIISRHGGWIDVESESGKGATFHVYLPASTEAVAMGAGAVPTHRGGGTIVVMDDEEIVRDTMRNILEIMGYKVICKNDGQTAIDFYITETKANRKLAAMIFDLTIPGGMGGLEAVREIRKVDKEIPIFVASGYADNFVMKNPVECGFTGSISKPFTIAELSEMLSRNIGSIFS